MNKQMIKLINYYQTHKNPNTPPRCVHYPSCSNYSKECYEKFNFFKATFLTTKRILFCTPLNHKAYDPVPLTKEEKQIEKALTKEAELIIPDLLKINSNNIEDYLNYIYLKDKDNIRILYREINVLSKLINKKMLPLDKKKSNTYIKEYISNGPYLIKNTN